MNQKAKAIFADYCITLIECPRDLAAWKMRVVRDFLESGLPFNKKGVAQYLASQKISGYISSVEVESVLHTAVGAKKRVAITTLKPDKHQNYNLTEEQEKSLKAFEVWMLKKKEFSPNTAKGYLTCVRAYFKAFDVVSQKNVMEFKNTMLNTSLARKTINLRLSGLTSYSEFIGKKIEIKRVKVLRSLDCNNVPTANEMDVFLKGLKGISKFWYLAARCLSTTGLRIHELMKITYKDVFSGSVILVGKGGKQRRVFFQRQFASEMREYFESSNSADTDLIFQRTTGGCAQQFRKYSKKLGLDSSKFHPHAFRHYFAKQYLQRNPQDIVGLQGLLGHSSMETTGIYLQRSFEEQLNDYHNSVTWQ